MKHMSNCTNRLKVIDGFFKSLTKISKTSNFSGIPLDCLELGILVGWTFPASLNSLVRCIGLVGVLALRCDDEQMVCVCGI